MTLPAELYPRPRVYEERPGRGALEPRRFETDASLPVQGFRLELTAEGSRLTAADEAGRRYGELARDQLARAGFARAAVLEDQPRFAHRAFMLDVSRDRVPTRETLAWLVGVLAALRYNGLQLYVEHTFAYRGHDVVWRDASPLTPEDLRWLDGLCRERGIELVANMNGFGHMGRWLAHDAYRARAECPEGFPAFFGEGTMAPTCLEPTPENAAFAVALAREMLESVASRRIHIGGDEPFELGDGRSAARVAAAGRDAVYLEHLTRTIEPLVADGCQVLFWADLFRRDPGLMPRLPAGATGVVWNYEQPSEQDWSRLLPEEFAARLGMPADAYLGFAAHARLFIEAGAPFWVAPGTASWNTLIGRNANAAGNLWDAAEVGAASGAEGYLVTDWGDNGHYQPLAVSLPSLVRGASAAWGAESREAPVGPVIDALLGAAPGFGQSLDRLGHVGEELGLTTPNGSPIFAACIDTPFPTMGELDPAGFARGREVLAEAGERFAKGALPGERGEILATELRAILGLADVGLRRLGAQRGQAVAAPEAEEVAARLAAQRAAWLRSSRPGGLEDSLAKFRR